MSTSPVPAHEVLECASSAGAFAAPSPTVDRDGASHCCAQQKAGLRPAVQKARAQMLDMSHRFFACSLSAQRYGVLRMTSVSIASLARVRYQSLLCRWGGMTSGCAFRRCPRIRC